jgi:MYXO-CTERM domain-containing protein
LLVVLVAAAGLMRAPAVAAAPAYGWRSVFPWPDRVGFRTVYDARRQRVLLSGAAPWEWNGATGTWAQRPTPSTLPMTANAGVVMAYDTARNVTVLLSPPQGFWERNGDDGVWTLRGGPQPSLTYAEHMIYDADLARFLVIARDKPSQPPTRIWEWDPATGTLAEATQTGASPTPGRTSAAMAYDAGRRRLVMFGGFGDQVAPDFAVSYLDDVWEWDPATGAWAARPTTGPKPSGRMAALAEYHAGRGHVFVFAGQDASWQFDDATGLADLWEWDGVAGAWIPHPVPAGLPAPAGGPGYTLTYDGSRGRLVIFGGQRDINSAGEIWQDAMEWNDAAGAWDDRRPPVGRESPAMAYDPAAGRVVMFGGYGNSYSYLNDLWQWNGADQTWSRRDLASPPPAREYGALAADEGRRTLVLCCGSGTSYWSDTWELDAVAGTWTSRQPASPASGRYPTLAYDPGRSKMYVYGTNATAGQVGEWDGTAGTWTWRPAADPKPSTRESPLVAFDVARERLVAFGGYTANSSQFLGDTWEWNPADGTWAARAPAGSLPAGRAFTAAYYDTLRSRVVMLGGTYSALADEPVDTAWEWDGDAGVWAALPIAADATSTKRPNVAYWPGVAFDRARGVAVTFGGKAVDYIKETWELAVTCPPAPASCVASGAPVDGGVSDGGGGNDGGARMDAATDAGGGDRPRTDGGAGAGGAGAGGAGAGGAGAGGTAGADGGAAVSDAKDAPVEPGRDAGADGSVVNRADAGRDGPAPTSAGGCSCRAGGPAGVPGSAWPALLAAMAAALSRRRRRDGPPPRGGG